MHYVYIQEECSTTGVFFCFYFFLNFNISFFISFTEMWHSVFSLVEYFATVTIWIYDLDYMIWIWICYSVRFVWLSTVRWASVWELWTSRPVQQWVPRALGPLICSVPSYQATSSLSNMILYGPINKIWAWDACESHTVRAAVAFEALVGDSLSDAAAQCSRQVIHIKLAL